jgi:hypothetical protein
MGNQNSRSAAPTSNPQSPTHNVTGASSHGHHPPHSQYYSGRRESIQALSTVKAPAAPEVSLETASAESHPTHSPRGRAQTVGTSTKAVANHLRAAQDTIKTGTTPDSSMGNEQSSQKGAHRDRDKHFPRDATPPQPQSTTIPQQQSEPEPAPRAPSPPTLPVDVPSVAREEARPGVQDREGVSSIDPADASQDYLIPSSQFSRPPRLPLPIEEEVHAPGSPIISPQEIWSPVHESDAEGMLPNRRTSMLSTTTADDEDLGDEFKGPSTGRPTVPTLIEWEGPGERVYVTGTFAGWNRKYKLHQK